MKTTNEIQKRNLKALATETEGLSTVEYVILLVLIALVGIVVWRTFGTTVASRVGQGTTQVQSM